VTNVSKVLFFRTVYIEMMHC